MKSLHNKTGKEKHMTETDLFKAKYRVYCSGTLIYGCNYLQRARDFVKAMELQDKQDGVYSPNSYKIEHVPNYH